MSLQYITDEKGKTTGVFIPIDEWNKIKSKFSELDGEAPIPEWHKEIVRKRMELHKESPQEIVDFEAALDDIENNI